MTNRLLISVATAALIAGTGFANAQGTGMGRESPSSGGGATMQHNSPSSGGASSGTMNRDSGGTTGMSGSDQSGKGSGSSGMRSDSDRGSAADRNAQDTAPGQKSKSMSSDERTKGDKGMKAEGRDSRDRMNAETRDKSGTETQKGATGTSRSQTTTGNAATSATAAPPAEKRTQIVSAIRSERVEEVRNVNFNVSVGTTVPSTVRFHALPSRIVEIYPEWRGYQFILVGGRYVIVRPETHEIVYILEG
ncbi:DUF1236 domain-containing protein [Bradyrhizobium cenepequi]